MFSGAGISGEAPASLPRGFELRDDLLRLIHAIAKVSLGPLVTDEQLAELVGSARKLEVVLARLSGAAGGDAADCVLALQVQVPNEAHMLAGLHLALGGTHVTLNFDIGIELAYELLTNNAAAIALPGPYRSALATWRALVPSSATALRIVVSHSDFENWLSVGQPALLKVHGSLSKDQMGLVDIVVLDIDEIGQLTPPRRAAVDSLGMARRLLITGYSGADPDVYQPLLAAAQTSVSSWCCYSLPADSPVPEDLQTRGIALFTGAPDGLAVTALRELVGLSSTPLWPDQPVAGSGYRERFDRWAEQFRAAHPADKIAVAWAWLLADGGDLDTAERMLAELAGRKGADPGTLVRYAEVLYTRARNDDRSRAGSLYRRVAADSRTDPETRLMCRLRSGDIARGRALRGGRAAILPLCRAFGQPVLVLITTRAGRREQEAAADAYRALQQTMLRILERAAGAAPKRSWSALAFLCRAARRLGGPAEKLCSNGNRRGLIRQHRLLLSAYSCLLDGRKPSAELRQACLSLRQTYRSADDPSGCGNLAVTLAVLEAAEGDLTSADRLLKEANDDYITGRPDLQPIASGAALLHAVERLLTRLR